MSTQGPSTSHEAEFYVQIEPELYGPDPGRVRSIKAVALTQKRPGRQRAGTVMVKLRVRVPDGAFLPLRPEAIVVIPEGMTVAEPITVEAEDPS
jgi:hypothetical protein